MPNFIQSSKNIKQRKEWMDKYRGNLTRDVQEERAARGLPPAAVEAIDNITPQPVPRKFDTKYISHPNRSV